MSTPKYKTKKVTGERFQFSLKLKHYKEHTEEWTVDIFIILHV